VVGWGGLLVGNVRVVGLPAWNLVGADLSEAYLGDADLSNAHVQGADLSGASIWNARFFQANLWCADLSNASILKPESEYHMDIFLFENTWGAPISWKLTCEVPTSREQS